MTGAARLTGAVRLFLVITLVTTFVWTWPWISPRIGDLFTIMWYLAFVSR